MESTKENESFFTKFMKHGGAGILAVLVIFLIFILCVTWLKSLAIGLLLAFLCLPVEKVFERIIFRSKKSDAVLTQEELKKRQVSRTFLASV